MEAILAHLLAGAIAISYHLSAAATPSPNVPCRPMRDYLPNTVLQSYDMRKHNGTWYEVAFRDLYPWGPICDCQQSVKYVNHEKGYIDDYFVFTCYPLKLNYISPQRENVTNGATGRRHENGIYDMTVAHSDFAALTKFEWNTEVIGFKDDGHPSGQYQWVIEFQCGTRPQLPKLACLGKLKNNTCSFTGVQMFVRDRDFIAQGRDDMIEYLRSLPRAAWVMDDFGPGTFPPWFKNVTWRNDCPMPCSSGVYNETTKMWGCPSEHRGQRINLANPLGNLIDSVEL